MNLNQATLIGRLTRDPEIKALPNGTKVTNFSIATIYSYKKEDGTKVENPEFSNCVAFGKVAEIIGQYLKKGQLAMIQGRLQTQSWDDKDSGKKMYRTEIIVEKMQMGPKAGAGSAEQPKEEKKVEPEIEYPAEDINPDDVPF